MSRGKSIASGLLAIAATLCGCATQPPSQAATQPKVAPLNLQGQWESGRLGYAHLIAVPDGTDVVVQVASVNGMTLPVHLYTYVHQGSCSGLGERMASATRRTLGYREISGLWTVRNTVPVSLDTLRASPHALAVWSSGADGNRLLYCGDLRWS
jgi:hypothetical protein